MTRILNHSDEYLIRSDEHSRFTFNDPTQTSPRTGAPAARRSNRCCAVRCSRPTSAAVGRTVTASTDRGTVRNDISPSAGLVNARGSTTCRMQRTPKSPNSSPTFAICRRGSTRSARSTPNCCGGARISDRWIRLSPLSTSPRRAPSSPI